MLEGDFFIIQSIRQEGISNTVAVELNAAHPIFKGHFPGQPVVPGACLLQMLKEIVQQLAGVPVQLKIAHQVKFISLIDPNLNAHLQLVINCHFSVPGELPVTAVISYDSTACFKFSGLFQRKEIMK